MTIEIYFGGWRVGESDDHRRLKVEIIAEVLRSLHYSWKDRKAATPYGLEKHLGLQGKRLKDLLAELRRIGLVDDRLRPTERGYAYLQDFENRVKPFLEKYDLSKHGAARSRKHSRT